MQKQAGRGQEYVKADMQGTACPYQREGGVYLDQQIGSQSTDQQIDYILPFIARDDPEKQAYKDGNREGESSLCHIYLEFVIACHGLIVRYYYKYVKQKYLWIRICYTVFLKVMLL